MNLHSLLPIVISNTVFALDRTLKEPVLADSPARKNVSSAAGSRRRGRQNTVLGRAIGITRSAARISLPLTNSRIVRLLLASCLACGMMAIITFLTGGLGIESRPFVAPHAFASAVLSTQPLSVSYPNCRFGIGQVRHSVMSYSVSPLNLGWYLNWVTSVNPPTPGGMEYVQVLRVSNGGYSPSGAALAERIAANPGALWLVGNEPDCIYQDNVFPQVYAQVYHNAYVFIKGLDPTARLAAGSIVQPTPLRMQYLDTVLDTYASLYGEPLPADAWNIHTFILREASCAPESPYKDSCWGAEIPPGIAVYHGTLYTLDDIDRQDIFQQRIVQFRQWMKDHGYQDRPLIITEYGTLLPYYDLDSLYYDSQGRPFDEARTWDFMRGTFDFLLAADDPDLGYPADENRLVQRWLWYSLDDTVYGGALFDPSTTAVLTLGTNLGAYTSEFSPVVDLLAVDVEQVGPVPYSPTSAATVTLRARISNIGNVAITQPVTVRFLDGEGHQIGGDQLISETVPGCAQVRWATLVWPDVTPGAHAVRVVVDPLGAISEGNESNNEVYGVALVAKAQVLLPLLARGK